MIEKTQFLTPSPLERIEDDTFQNLGITVYIKRDDLIHPVISGNKWRKLKYNILHVINGQHPEVVSFGGPYSNHLLAIAEACVIYNIRLHAYIRGAIDHTNPAIIFLKSKQVHIHSLEYGEYRKRYDPAFIHQIMSQHDEKAYYIPEGGNNESAQEGLKELAEELNQELETFDYITIPIGTASSFEALKKNMPPTTCIEGYCIFTDAQNRKQKSHMELSGYNGQDIIADYNFGGLGSYPEELINFVKSFKQDTGIQLDRSYNAKMMYGLYDRICQGNYPRGSKIVAINTGGNFVDKLNQK